METTKEFTAPTTAQDFPEGKETIKHTYENGNAVVFVILSDNRIAKIREGIGEDVERATMESQGNQSKYLSSMMAATVTIDGKGVNMYDLAQRKMKDYLRIQSAFADLNF
jgi:hypothetical protein